jgi:hypothetical protein
MKELIDITDEDVISVINRIHLLTENRVISRNGILGLDFYESFRKYGDCYIDIELVSSDTITDGYFTIISKCRMQFHHKSVWFTEFGINNNFSGHNRNHFFGYLKLQELGYKLPNEPQWT